MVKAPPSGGGDCGFKSHQGWCVIIHQSSSPAGLEPAISRFVVLRLIHWATGTISYIYHSPRAGLEPATAGFEVQRAIHCANEASLFIYAPTRARTGDLSVNSRPLCQLSHGSNNYY